MDKEERERMNEYTYEQIAEGHTESFQVTLTEEMMEQFLRITGDVNPLHRDAAYARTRHYADKVVYGMLTSSFYSTLAGVYLPGKYSLIHSVESKFLRPVYVGDTLTVSGVVKEKEEACRMLIVKLLITDQSGEKVSKGTMQIKMLDSSDLGTAYIGDKGPEYARIIAHYHHDNDKFAALRADYGDRITPIQADFGDRGSVLRFVEAVKASAPAPTHVLHLVSPPAGSVRFHKCTVDDYEKMMQVSFYSIVEILRAFLPAMQKAGFGRIVFMLSAYVKIPDPKYAAPYVAAKYALLGLMKDIAAEYASKGITANGVSPQMIETKFLQEIPELILEKQRIAGPLKRLLTTDDILPVMHMLLSDAAAVTGENIGITGGNYIL